jgi:hypothetical protein
MRKNRSITSLAATLFLLLSLLLAVVPAQKTTPPATSQLSQAEIDRVIRAFSTKETEFRRALNDYAFKRDATMQTVGMGGQITGEYRRVSSFTFDDSGVRFEKISFFPMSTITEVQITNEDLEDLGGVNAFALEAGKLNQYTFNYAGKERIDEIDTYVFDVVPKVDLKSNKVSERFFMGRIWVDDRDLQIVKAKGKGVPEGKQRFPVFETYRENVDGKYWFPAYVYSDDSLVFPGGQVVRMRMVIKYTDYKRARADVKVIDGDVVDETEPQTKPTPKPTPTPTPTPTPSPTPKKP